MTDETIELIGGKTLNSLQHIPENTADLPKSRTIELSGGDMALSALP